MKITLPPSLALALLAIVILLAPINPPAPVFAADRTPTPTKPFPMRSSPSVTSTYYFPLVLNSPSIDPCSSIPGQSYSSVVPDPPKTDRPADQHADLNLEMRGYIMVNESKTLVDYGGSSDPSAPQLATLFSNSSPRSLSNTYQVGHWDWECNCRDRWDDEWPVELLGMGSMTGEIINTPSSGYDIGTRPQPRLPNGFEVMVLYATTHRITIKYTRNDNVVIGYTIHVEDICVEPTLLALYNTLNSQGRNRLPALYALQPFGRARGGEIKVAIRDSGMFMDPRSRNDWWVGY
jgi:hypothetical protein